MSLQLLTEQFWSESLEAYRRAWAAWGGQHRHDDTPAKAINGLACSVLADLVRHSRVKVSERGRVFGHDLFPGVALWLHSGPIAQHIRFGLWLDHWYVETLLPYIDGIPHVTEEFWDGISEICHLAPTSFDENEAIPVTSTQGKRFMRSGRSVHYRITRNFILRRSDPESRTDDIGALRSEVSIDGSLTETLTTLRSLYKNYCRCLQQLYRNDSQRSPRSGIRAA